MPASRRQAAIARLPRSWPSSPILVMITLGGRFSILSLLDQPHEFPRKGAWGVAPFGVEPEGRPVQGADEHEPQRAAIGAGRQRQAGDRVAEVTFMTNAQSAQAVCDARNVVRHHADQHLCVIAVAQYGLEMGAA